MSDKDPKELTPEATASERRSDAKIEVRSSAYRFSGPLPEPNQLSRYNDLIPDGADRIMAMAERQSAHRIQMEMLLLRSNIGRERRGSWFAFTLALIAIVGGFYLIHEGKSAQGLVAIIGSVVTLAGIFVYAQQQQQRERKEKAMAIQAPGLATSPTHKE